MAAYNNSPILSMNEIVSHLWNNQCLSDIEFHFNGERLFGHSLLLSARSLTFEEKFATNMGERKLIPIENYKYENFKEFLRFIYQDVCTISTENTLELLQLAIMYKVPKLENLLIADIIRNYEKKSIENKMKLFEFCASINYELLSEWITEKVANDFDNIIKSSCFLNLKPETVEQLLRFGTTTGSLSEFDIFSAILKWMETYCDQHKINLTARRSYFHNIILLIRFPVMTLVQFNRLIKTNKDLFSDEEIVSFYNGNPIDTWISEDRKLKKPREKGIIAVNANCLHAHFTPKNDLILSGLLVGSLYQEDDTPLNMIMSVHSNDTVWISPITFTLSKEHEHIISLGELIRLTSCRHYTVRVSVPEIEAQRILRLKYRRWFTQQSNTEIENNVKIVGELCNLKFCFKNPIN